MPHAFRPGDQAVVRTTGLVVAVTYVDGDTIITRRPGYGPWAVPADQLRPRMADVCRI